MDLAICTTPATSSAGGQCRWSWWCFFRSELPAASSMALKLRVGFM
ncbi:hypothetical protein A2U01_0048988, partial [Trifolium medium]|nr:hypothetical protein [Trifolium medium]